ncbi:MAG: hypothetical protein ACRCTJ_06525 [Brevinema sp.]
MIRATLIFLLFSACKIIPDNYRESLIGSWFNEETIETSGGRQKIQYTATFNLDSTYFLEVIHPVTGTQNLNLTYQVGSIDYFPVFNLRNVDGKDVGFPQFYYFQNNDSILVTSTNKNIIFPKRWTKK